MQLFLHTWRQVFGNLGAALRIGWLLLVLGGAPTFMGINGLAPAPEQLQALQLGPTMLAMLTFWLIAWVSASVYVAITWHRFVLRAELPATVLPAPTGGSFWAYLRRSALIGLLIVFGVSMALVAVGAAYERMLMIVANFNPALAVVITGLSVVVFTSLLLQIMMRMSLILPAAALDLPMKIGESWAATMPVAGALFRCALILVAINFTVELALGQMLDAGFVMIAGYLSIVLQWLGAMLVLSLLTTLYGHLIEGRALSV